MIQEILCAAPPVLNEFELVEPDKTRAFLEQHSFMEPLLAELLPQLRPYFPLSPLRPCAMRDSGILMPPPPPAC